jgi:hypothetical protein
MLQRSFLHEGVNMELWEIKVSKDDHVFRSVHASLEEAELSVIALCYFIEHMGDISQLPEKLAHQMTL